MLLACNMYNTMLLFSTYCFFMKAFLGLTNLLCVKSIILGVTFTPGTIRSGLMSRLRLNVDLES